MNFVESRENENEVFMSIDALLLKATAIIHMEVEDQNNPYSGRKDIENLQHAIRLVEKSIEEIKKEKK